MDLVISAATHRSGSTLLQRIFNARDKTLIWGENGGCLTDFCRVYQNTKHYAGFRHRDAYFKNDEDPNQWIACMTPPKDEVDAAMIDTVKTFHERLYVNNYRDEHDFIGYKEVRYGQQELQLLRKCYPECTVILLVRNPIDSWKSLSPKARRTLYGSMVNFTKIWNERIKDYIEMSKSYSNMHLIRYEDLNARHPETINLIQNIGHLEEQDIQRVLDRKINSSSKPLSPKSEELIIKRCSQYMKELGYLK